MTEIKTLREILSASRRAVFFGGAGMSTESGIPDFRSAGGIYSETLHQEFRSMTKRIADKTVPWVGVDFSSERGGKPDAEWCSALDFPPKCGQTRCVKMARLNVSVLPKIAIEKGIHK